MRIRSVREGDWKTCLTLDGSYETEIAWQMEDLSAENEHGACFRAVRLPRRQRIALTLAPEVRLDEWARCDAFWVATEHRKIQGYMALALEPGGAQGRIVDLVVDVAYRRQGVASELLQHAIAWALRKEVSQLILPCPLKAQPAIGFAGRHRFVFSGYQDAYWPGQEVALFFRKRIP